MRDRDPSDPEIAFTDSAKWTMYEGDSPVIDYEFDDLGVMTAPKDYELGLAEYDDSIGFATYTHGNHLGTTALHTFDSGGGPEPYAHRPVYTAFGERVSSSGLLNPDSNAPSRYGYVGAHGYETLNDGASGFDMTYLHVGGRYYSPTLGRFLQRDPIGIRGGLNVYLYVGANPARAVDPAGLTWEYVPLPSWNEVTPRTPLAPGSALNPRGLTMLLGRAMTTNMLTVCAYGGAVYLAAETGWQTGRYLDESLGLSDSLGEWLGNTLPGLFCPDCYW
jgi:RHS repeat-associated protein